MESVPENKGNFKRLRSFMVYKEIVTLLILILTATASFGLGRLSALDNVLPKEEVRIGEVDLPTMSASVYSTLQQTEDSKQLKEPQKSDELLLVASKNGTKYYFTWCGGVSRIKEENKVYFSSYEEARQAGYSPAANCKGLE